jgi:hypothetical protein
MDQDLAMRFGALEKADLSIVLEFLLPGGALDAKLVKELLTGIPETTDVTSIKPPER